MQRNYSMGRKKGLLGIKLPKPSLKTERSKTGRKASRFYMTGSRVGILVIGYPYCPGSGCPCLRELVFGRRLREVPEGLRPPPYEICFSDLLVYPIAILLLLLRQSHQCCHFGKNRGLGPNNKN